MAIQFSNKLVADWYVPTSQQEAERPARFKLRGLTGQQWLDVMFGEGAGKLALTAKGVNQALQYGLIDWEGIEDEDGQPLKFRPQLLDAIPAMLRVELASEIVNRSKLTEDDAKN